MNIGFIINNVFVTPMLEETILNGVTRRQRTYYFKRYGY